MNKSNKFRLGQLCSNGHDYNGQGQSLRYVSSANCVICSANYRKKYREEKGAEFFKKYSRYYQEDEELKEKYRLQRNEYYRRRYQEKRESYRQYSAEYYRKNKERFQARRQNVSSKRQVKSQEVKPQVQQIHSQITERPANFISLKTQINRQYNLKK